MVGIKIISNFQDYFGKSGISVHIDVFLIKINDVWIKAVYIVVLDKCDQDMIETLAIAQIVLEKFNADFPHIKSLLIKSDNAGCYHAAPTVEVLINICKKLNMSIDRYDFSEPQHGKDACDREAAYIKRRYRDYLNKHPSHKVSNATELVKAIMSDGGPKNSKAITLNINKSQTKLNKKCTIKNISFYHSFVPKDEGIICFEYYKIGKGKIHHFIGVDLDLQVEKSDWVMSFRQDMAIERAQNQNLFVCRTAQCQAVFPNQSDLLQHQSIGKHTFIQPKTNMDRAREYFVKQKNEHVVEFAAIEQSAFDISKETSPEQKSQFLAQFKQGWARPKRKVVKFTDKQKTYIRNLYKEGEKSKNKKIDYHQMADMMKKEKKFAPNERLNPEQIKGLVRRFMMESKKYSTSDDATEEDEVLY